MESFVEPADDFADLLFSTNDEKGQLYGSQHIVGVDNASVRVTQLNSHSEIVMTSLEDKEHFQLVNAVDTIIEPSVSTFKEVADTKISTNAMADPSQSLEKSEVEMMKKAKAAAAGRKSRLKRKQEKLELDARNEELEREQESFRAEIATLQSEIQHLKQYSQYAGIDLKTQNLLLRAEVKRHKTFVNNIKTMINNIPQYTNLEKLKLANEGIESAIGQVIGMCYTSVLDRSWQVVEYNPKLGKHLEGLKVVCRYQFLPEGSTPETATRLNFRTDIYNMPITYEKMKGLISENWSPSLEKMYRRKYMDLVEGEIEIQSLVDLELDRLDLDFSALSVSEPGSNKQNPDIFCLSSNENIPLTDAEKSCLRPLQVFRYRETRQPLVEGEPHRTMEKIEIRSCVNEMTVNAFGFPRSKDAKNFVTSATKEKEKGDTTSYDPQCNCTGETISESSAKLNVFLAVGSEASHEVGPILKPRDRDIERFQADFIKGRVIREGEMGPEFTDSTQVGSYPLLTGSFFEYDKKVLTAFEDSPNATPTRIPSKIRLDIGIMETLAEEIQF